jgi:hypothetical protein
MPKLPMKLVAEAHATAFEDGDFDEVEIGIGVAKKNHGSRGAGAIVRNRYNQAIEAAAQRIAATQRRAEAILANSLASSASIRSL